MSLWAEYIKERENCETIESPAGFITYKIYADGICFVRDFFVTESQRESGRGAELFATLTMLAHKHGCKKFVAQVILGSTDPTLSLKVILSREFRVVSANGGIITLEQEIEERG